MSVKIVAGSSYSEEEDQMILKMVEAGMTNVAIAGCVGRSHQGIGKRIAQLRRQGLANSDRLTLVNRIWSEEELSLLAGNIDIGIAALCDLFPHRSRMAIETKRAEISAGERKKAKEERIKQRQVAEEVTEEEPIPGRQIGRRFVTKSGVPAIYTRSGLVPYVSILYAEI